MLKLIGDVALGGAVLVLPQGRLPLLCLTLTVQTLRAWQDRKQQARSEDAELDSTLPPAVLTFESLCCTLPPPKGSDASGPRFLLDNVTGSATPGRLLAIMGASGAGKTTLLNALASHTPVTRSMRLSGRLRINGASPAASRVRVGYVQQEDLFYSQMTVRETLDMTAALRLPPSTSAEARRAVVDDALRQLDLATVADTLVGDRKTRGISGGERKRLSIASEILARPSLLFLDEPTTGLDAFQALKVIEALSKLAASGHTVVASVHQPRSRIFDLFDDLVLLAPGGRVAYAGPTDAALEHFAAQGHECPPHHNPAEFFADLISPDGSTVERAKESTTRLDALVGAAPAADVSEAHAGAEASSGAEGAVALGPQQHQPPPLKRQLGILLKRSWRQASRDTATIKLRAATNIQSAIVFGGIWWRLRRLQKSVASRLGLLQVVAVYMSQSALFKTLNLFPPEKLLVSAERAKGSYAVGPYFVAKLVAELPLAALYPLLFSAVVYPMTNLQPSARKFATFAGSNFLEVLASSGMGMAVGAVSPSTEAALVIGPAVMLIFIVFGGLYTNQDDVPRWLRWVPNTSQIKTGYDALVKNEFAGLELAREGPGSFQSGEDVLQRSGFKGGVAPSLVQQGRIVLFHWWLTFCLLRSQTPRFQEMVEPADAGARPGEA